MPSSEDQSWTEVVDALIDSAVHADCRRRDDGDLLVASLVDGPPTERGRHLVAAKLDDLLATYVSSLLCRGWEPVDLFQAVRRKAPAAAAGVMVVALDPIVSRVAPAPLLDRWTSQVDQIESPKYRLDPATAYWEPAVAGAVAALAVLTHLPPIADLSVLAGSNGGVASTSSHADSVLDKVRNLLAKAESTNFPEEADAFTSKAQELITRHNLEGVLSQPGQGAGSAVDARRCWIDDPYFTAKGFLLSVVADANRCTAILSDLGFVAVIGYSDDIDVTELLFASLLVQATRRMAAVAAGARSGTRSRRPSFRRSFLTAYATRIGQRLSEATAASTAEADSEAGGSLLPVLARRQEDVDSAVDELFPDVGSRRNVASDYAGWIAGTAAADLADLADQHQRLAR